MKEPGLNLNRTQHVYLFIRSLPKGNAWTVGAFWLIYVLDSSLPIQLIPPGGYPTVYLLVLISSLFNFYFSPPRHWNKIGIILYLLFFLLFFASLTWTPPDVEADLVQRIIIYAFCGLCAMQIVTKRDRQLILSFMVIASIIIAVFTLYTSITDEVNGYRGGSEINPNYLSLNIALGLFVAIPNAIEANINRMLRLALMTGIILMSYTLILLASRGTIIALGFVLMLVSFRYARSLRQGISGAIVGGLTSYLIVFTSVFSGVAERFAGSDMSTFNDRLPIWNAALDEIRLRQVLPVFFGSGSGSSTLLANSINSQLNNIHNTYIQVLYELGVIGMLAFLLMLISCFVYIRKEKSRDGFIVQLLIVGCSVMAFSGTSSDQFQWWIIIALGLVSPIDIAYPKRLYHLSSVYTLGNNAV